MTSIVIHTTLKINSVYDTKNIHLSFNNEQSDNRPYGLYSNLSISFSRVINKGNNLAIK